MCALMALLTILSPAAGRKAEHSSPAGWKSVTGTVSATADGMYCHL
jgi:hypothetical protein